MDNYLRLMKTVMRDGAPRMDRTGVGTSALFGTSLEFDMSTGLFPLLTTKRMAWAQIVAELTCFLRGYDMLSQFHMTGCTIWDKNAAAPYWKDRGNTRASGDVWLGRVYGVQWRRWARPQDLKEFDQLAEAVRLIQEDPHSRRICVTAWNPGELSHMCLPPCHLYYQFFAEDAVDSFGGERKFLDVFVVMRSVDVFIGMPFDIASYALLLAIVAKQTGRTPRKLTMQFADTHVYKNHERQVKIQLDRSPLPLPTIQLADDVTIDNFDVTKVKLLDYHSWAGISAEMNV